MDIWIIFSFAFVFFLYSETYESIMTDHVHFFFLSFFELTSRSKVSGSDLCLVVFDELLKCFSEILHHFTSPSAVYEVPGSP